MARPRWKWPLLCPQQLANNEQLVALAHRNGDELLTLMADDFSLDGKRHKETAKALVSYAVQHKPELRDLLKDWVEKWSPLAHRALEGLSSCFGEAPHPLESEKVVKAIDERHQAFLAECGLQR